MEHLRKATYELGVSLPHRRIRGRATELFAQEIFMTRVGLLVTTCPRRHLPAGDRVLRA